MRVRELLDTLVGRDPEDIVGIGVHLGAEQYDSTAIARIVEFDGGVLLYTPKSDRYKGIPS